MAIVWPHLKLPPPCKRLTVWLTAQKIKTPVRSGQILTGACFYAGSVGAGVEPSLEYSPYNMWFGLPVFVTNSDSSPVPVKGELGITGTADVNIVNTDITPVPVRNPNEPGREPYQVQVEYDFVTPFCRIFSDGDYQDCPEVALYGEVLLFDLPDVPIGKRLILKRVSGWVPATESIGIHVAFQTEKVISLQTLKWLFPGPFFKASDLVYGFDSGDLFLIFDSGETPRLNIQAPSFSSATHLPLTLSGYLIDADN